MKQILNKFEEQVLRIKEDIREKEIINIGTLGPSGTSSEQAMKYLINAFREVEDSCKYNIVLENDFQYVLNDLENSKLDYALVPSAYDRITDFFWSYNITNVLNFIYETPDYGLVCLEGYKPANNNKVRVATCSAVRNIIKYLCQDIVKDKEVEIVEARSTTESLLFLLEGKADAAITNETSFQIYKHKGIKFVSDKYNTHVVLDLIQEKIN